MVGFSIVRFQNSIHGPSNRNNTNEMTKARNANNNLRTHSGASVSLWSFLYKKNAIATPIAMQRGVNHKLYSEKIVIVFLVSQRYEKQKRLGLANEENTTFVANDKRIISNI